MFSSDGSSSRHLPRIGVAGAGYWGANLVRVCAQLGVLASVCEVAAEVRESVRKSYPGVDVVSDFDQLLRTPIDAVVIATPAQLHTEMALAAIAAGKHVFVEKPLALTVADGEQVAEAAESRDIVVFVGHLLLYHPAVEKLQKLIAEERIGRVYHVRSRRLSLGKLRSHENVWWSFAPHDVALMLMLLGEEPHSVSAAQTTFRNSLSDIAYADFQFSNDRTAHVETCWLDPEKSARLDVFGDQGVLTLTDSRQGSSLWLRTFSINEGLHGAPIVSRGFESEIDFEKKEPLEVEVRAFIDAVQTGVAYPSTGRHGVAVLRALSMADRWQTGATIKRAAFA